MMGSRNKCECHRDRRREMRIDCFGWRGKVDERRKAP